ncbi:MAG: general stress protein CsbD [Bacteroidota bacterium]
MNTTALTGDWNVQKKKLKQKFAWLTDDDLSFEEAKKGEMLERLQLNLGKPKENSKRSSKLYNILSLKY